MSELRHKCPYNSGVTCGWQECDRCGWNPDVSKKRKALNRGRVVRVQKQITSARGRWYIGRGPFPER